MAADAGCLALDSRRVMASSKRRWMCGGSEWIWDMWGWERLLKGIWRLEGSL